MICVFWQMETSDWALHRYFHRWAVRRRAVALLRGKFINFDPLFCPSMVEQIECGLPRLALYKYLSFAEPQLSINTVKLRSLISFDICLYTKHFLPRFSIEWYGEPIATHKDSKQLRFYCTLWSPRECDWQKRGFALAVAPSLSLGLDRLIFSYAARSP